MMHEVTSFISNVTNNLSLEREIDKRIAKTVEVIVKYQSVYVVHQTKSRSIMFPY